MAKCSPHAGLIKAAVNALGSSDPGRKRYSPVVEAEAIKRVRKAHEQLSNGDYNMAMTAEEKAAIADPLNSEIAVLRNKIEDVNTEKAGLVTTTSLIAEGKDKEIAGLTEQLRVVSEEKAALETKINDTASTEVASQRLARLVTLGFTVKDDEKAALMTELKSEADLQFEIRFLKEENASITRKYAAGGKVATADEIAGLNKEDEHAGLKEVLSVKGKDVPNAYSVLA
jgi:hypothetical protein